MNFTCVIETEKEIKIKVEGCNERRKEFHFIQLLSYVIRYETDTKFSKDGTYEKQPNPHQSNGAE